MPGGSHARRVPDATHCVALNQGPNEPRFECPTKQDKSKRPLMGVFCFCAPGGIRTPNLLIRSQMLYPLSYGRSVENNFESIAGLGGA